MPAILNKAQQEAVEYTNGPLLIIAGAGTGKTTVITEKIAFLIKEKLAKPEEILALTFTEKAAGEMEERVDKLLDLGYTEMQISTFHAFCQRLLEHHALDIGISNQFKLLTQTDAWLLVRQHLDKFNLDYYRPLGNPTKHIHEFIKHFSKCKDELISPDEYLKYAESVRLDGDNAEFSPDHLTTQPLNHTDNTTMVQCDNGTIDAKRLTEVANAYHTYNQLLLDNNCLDFGDLIFYTIKLLRERPAILKLLQEKYKYILVDEFQDVNYAQYELVKLFCGSKNQLTVVGDDDQSIYAFRGASVSNILRFKDDFENAKEIVLNENYRSGQEILDLAYKSIQNNNPDRLEAKLKIDKKLKSKIEQKLEKNLTKINNVKYTHFLTADEEVNYIVKKIREISDGQLLGLSDIAILIRANSHAEPFINALQKAGIPFEYLASSGLYRQPIVLDCLNFLKVIDNYHESSAIYRLLRLPFFNFRENDLQTITYLAKKKSVSYYEAIKRAQEFKLSKEGIEVCDKLVSLIHEGMKETRTKKPTVILLEFLEQSGYFSYLTREEGQACLRRQGNREVIHQLQQLRKFFEEIKKFEETVVGANVASFLEHYNFVIDSGDEGSMYQPSEVEDAVNILTVHSAKGLEFKYVFVVNLVEERFPSRRRGEGIELPLGLVKEKLPEGDFHIQEERRLFYVACTRAKEKLFLTSAEDYGGARKKKVSRFVDELGFKVESNTASKTNLSDAIKISSKKDPSSPLGGLPQDERKNFSYSQINSYQRCPYQYKLMHILKIPTKGNASFSFGQTMHSTLQKFYERVREFNSAKQDSLFDQIIITKSTDSVKVPTLDELLKLYEDSWQDDWYKDKKQREDYYQKGKDILKIFYVSQQELGWSSPVALEGWFKIKVGDYLINGRIDRIDQHADGTLEIIDYKTGKSKEKIIGDDKNQLLIYQLATQNLPEYKNIGETGKLTFYYLEDDLRTSFIGDDKDLEKVQEKIIETVDKIKANDFHPEPGKHTCQYCDFRDICEFRVI